MHPFFAQVIADGNPGHWCVEFKEDRYADRKFALLAEIEKATREVKEAMNSSSLKAGEYDQLSLALAALREAPDVIESIWAMSVENG